MKIAYVKHPVTPEEKAKLRAGGYQIIDARFAPKDYQGKAIADADDLEPIAVDNISLAPSTDEGELKIIDLDSMSADELRDVARNLGIPFHGSSGAEKIKQAIIDSGLLAGSD